MGEAEKPSSLAVRASTPEEGDNQRAIATFAVLSGRRPREPRALRLWYYPGRLSGDEFPYPKHSLQLAQAEPIAAAAPRPEPAPEPQASPNIVAGSPAPPPVQEPVQLAQNNPPPPPLTSQTVETPAPPASTDASARALPKTASPYPLFGVTGVVSLALLGILRLKQPATQES